MFGERACGDRLGVGARQRNPRGCRVPFGFRFFRREAKLAETVFAEGVQLAGGGQREAVFLAGRDLDDGTDLAQQPHQRRRRVGFLVVVAGVVDCVAELAVGVAAERVELAGRGDGKAEEAAGGDVDDRPGRAR